MSELKSTGREMTSPRPHIKVMVQPETKQSPGLIFNKVHLNRQFCSLFFQEVVSLGFSFFYKDYDSWHQDRIVGDSIPHGFFLRKPRKMVRPS